MSPIHKVLDVPLMRWAASLKFKYSMQDVIVEHIHWEPGCTHERCSRLSPPLIILLTIEIKFRIVAMSEFLL